MNSTARPPDPLVPEAALLERGAAIRAATAVAFDEHRGVLEALGDGWRLVFNDGKVDQALDFSLEEVKEARLVPVVDFKGRRFAPAADDAAQGQVKVDDVDGDRKQ